MKIGIITIPDYTNFGNRLQNYAVHYVLKNRFGCKTVSLVSYAEKPFENGNYLLWAKNEIAKGSCVIPQLAERRFGNGITRWRNFCKWNRKYIPTKNYYGRDSLPESLNREYDIFFAGSDQIWNYRFPGTKWDDYFLKFAERKKKAAISGSFGVEEIPEEWKQSYRDGLSDFAHISVREDAGTEIVWRLLGREVPVLVDPVMLLSCEEWLAVSKKPRADLSKPYVLKYYLGDQEQEDKLEQWAKENHFEVYELLDDKVPELYSAGPGEFLSLIANAALVASDSFHCIAFSIIFRRPFVVYPRRGAENYMTSRMDTLLKKFNFQGRWDNRLIPEEYFACDFHKTDEIMRYEQNKALEYIQNVLESVK